MLSSYVKLALRNLAKNRLYAFINIAGLALGLTVFLFSTVFVAYESGYDRMFSRHDRIFVVYSRFSPDSGIANDELDTIRLAYGPLFEAEINEAEQVARTVMWKSLITIDNTHRYQGVRFVDTGFTRVFDFRYIHGDKTALDDGRGLIITASKARELFGRVDAVGETITLEHEYDMRVAAVIEDLPEATHFKSLSAVPGGLTVVAPFRALVNITDITMQGNWRWLSRGRDRTYILLPENRNRAWLQEQVNAVYERHTPHAEREFIAGLDVRPLTQVNKEIWDDYGLPILESVRLLGILVLIIACVNYANLATAQSFNRTREVGLRKAFGAGRAQLFWQHTIESLTVAVFAMMVAVAGTELLIPMYNAWTGKDMAFEHIRVLPFLALTTFVVGLVAGAYPAYLVSRFNPIESLRGVPLKGRKGVVLRGFMIAAQFSASVFILAMVMVIHFQNGKMQSTGDIFPASRIVVLHTNGKNLIRRKYNDLRREISALAGVEAVAFSNTVPLGQATWRFRVTPEKGGKARAIEVKMVSVDYEFMDIYDIELLAGRPFRPEFARDISSDPDDGRLNVIANRLAAEKLGLLAAGESDEKALGKSFYRVPDDSDPTAHQYTVIGVMENVNLDGLYNPMDPVVFFIIPDYHYQMSIKLNGENPDQTLAAIDSVWERLVDDYPIQRRWLKHTFNRIMGYFHDINRVLAACAGVALSLALIGLFGLTAFMARRRTREIGIRKVMGAGRLPIVRLLVWQFSVPVIASLPAAIPAAWLASRIYLDYFAQRINYALPVILAAGAACLLLAWTVVALHALKVARTRPADSLRYE